MPIPHVILRVRVEGRWPSADSLHEVSSLLILSQADYAAARHLDEAHHRARLLGLVETRVVDVRQVATTIRPYKPLRRRGSPR